MESILLNKKPQRLWEWREYKNGSLIENGIALNETATFIWKLCDGKGTINRIILELFKKYDVSKQRAKKDVLNCIKILAKERTIQLN